MDKEKKKLVSERFEENGQLLSYRKQATQATFVAKGVSRYSGIMQNITCH